MAPRPTALGIPLPALLPLAFVALSGACDGRKPASDAAAPAVPDVAPLPDPTRSFVVLAAGDIGHDDPAVGRQKQTADLLSGIIRDKDVRAVLALGDLAYYSGLPEEFAMRYHPFWGRPDIAGIIRPVPGNHEYRGGALDAAGYFDYFNGVGVEEGRAGRRGRGYYSFDVGSWHFVALNSGENPGCNLVPCEPGSPQHTWLLEDLRANTKKCTIAYWHHPRFNQSVAYGDHPAVAPLWDALHDAGADIVLAGHTHNYQQFAPMDKAGMRDPMAGMRQFIVGTGGMAVLYNEFTALHADTLEYKDATTHGVLELTLDEAAYSWRFVTIDGRVLADGNDVCR